MVVLKIKKLGKDRKCDESSQTAVHRVRSADTQSRKKRFD